LFIAQARGPVATRTADSVARRLSRSGGLLARCPYHTRPPPIRSFRPPPPPLERKCTSSPHDRQRSHHPHVPIPRRRRLRSEQTSPAITVITTDGHLTSPPSVSGPTGRRETPIPCRKARSTTRVATGTCSRFIRSAVAAAHAGGNVAVPGSIPRRPTAARERRGNCGSCHRNNCGPRSPSRYPGLSHT
jgi:hypothetical protein